MEEFVVQMVNIMYIISNGNMQAISVLFDVQLSAIYAPCKGQLSHIWLPVYKYI